MVAPTQGVIDIVAARLLFEAQEALNTFKKVDIASGKTQTNFQKLAIAMKKVRDETGRSISEIAKEFEKINNPKGGGQFGSLGVNNAQIQELAKRLQIYEKMIPLQAKSAAEANKASAAIKQTGVAGAKAGQQIESGFQRSISSINIMRIALGALVSMLLFQVLQAIQTVFKTAIDNAKELEVTIYRLGVIEKTLSMEGVNISMKGLRKGIDDIRKLLPIFSKEDIAETIGAIGLSTKELGFTEKQILDLGKAAAILNVNSAAQETILDTQAHLVTSLLTNNAKGVSQLGLSFSAVTMQAKGMELGILKAGDAVSDLTDKQKAQIKYAIILEVAGVGDAAKELENVSSILETNFARIEENKAAWNDLLTIFGQILLPFIPAVTSLFETLSDSLNGIKVILTETLSFLGTFGVMWKAVFSGNIKSVEDFNQKMQATKDIMRSDFINTFFDEVPEDAPQWFKDAYGDMIKIKETATGMPDPLIPEPDEGTLEALADIDEKIQDIIIDAQQAQEDLDLKRDQKNTDLNTEYDRKGVDAAIDHADKLEDINQDTLEKIEDAKRKAREDELKAEQDLLQKLKELRQRFLMDLEDALHARDARQVLRLIREYKFDKQNILDKKKLEDQQRADSLAADLAAIEVERKRRIESENIEYQRKLSDLNEAKAREQADIQRWYDREQEDIANNIKQKMEKLLAGYIAEGTLHETEQGKIYDILKKYFGYDMELVDGLYKFMSGRFAGIAAMAQQAASLVATASAGIAGFGAVGSYAGGLGSGYSVGGGLASSGGTSGKPGRRGFAEGGSVLATKPTRAIFGERGAELATFTPLGRTGKDVNKLFGDVSGGGVSGMAKVLLTLSPDLRGEILSDAMDGVAVVIEHVRRER